MADNKWATGVKFCACSSHFLFGFLGNKAGFMVNEISQKPKSVEKMWFPEIARRLFFQ